MPVEIHQVRTDVTDAWVAWDGDPSKDYAYGGCRLVGRRTGYEDAIGMLCALMRNESGYKNALINLAVEDGALDDLSHALPPGFARARVGGGRCVIRPARAPTNSSPDTRATASTRCGPRPRATYPPKSEPTESACGAIPTTATTSTSGRWTRSATSSTPPNSAPRWRSSSVRAPRRPRSWTAAGCAGATACTSVPLWT